MRRHWKDLAERAAKSVFAKEAVREALPHALKKDVGELPLDRVRDILGGGRQGKLFQEDRIAQLEETRNDCRGSALGNALINCAIEAVTDGLTGDNACKTALKNAFDEYTRNAFRGVEEHYQREGSDRSARFVRERLDAARSECDFGGLASEIMSPNKLANSPSRLLKHMGIDEGPALP
jgi:hypothetical protein